MVGVRTGDRLAPTLTLPPGSARLPSRSPRPDLRRQLIELGAADVVHGHSSHHVKAIEVYRERLILYGCGDFFNDYEGISGYEQFRDDLRLLYFVPMDTRTRELRELRLVPMRSRRMRLERATREDAAWLHRVLNDASSSFGTTIGAASDGTMTVVAP